MWRVVGGRLLSALPNLAGVVVITFILTRALPGDPEIRIPAPRDARAVTVVLPFGETADAVWEDEPVSFGPGAGDSCKDGLIARVRGALRPAPGMPLATRIIPPRQ